MYCVLNAQTLKFGSDRKFKIVQFTDVHWVSGSEHSVVSEKCMNRVLDEEKPDLVVYTGDQIKGYGVTYKGMGSELVNNVAKTIDKLIEPVTKRNIPFAVTFGNHDEEGTSPFKVSI